MDENIQYNFVYLIDTSDSVVTDTLQQAKQAYISLTQSLIDRGIADVSKFAIIPFGTEAYLETPENATEAIATIEGLSGNGFTNFNAALETANQFLSTAPSGARNIAYFLSDGYSTTGGSFDDSAKALKDVAEVRAYGFGLANIIDLRIIDSDQPDIVSEPSLLATNLVASADGLVVNNPQVAASETNGDSDIEIASAPLLGAIEENSSDTITEQILQTNEENQVDDSVVDASLTSTELPIINFTDVSIEEGNLGTSIAQFTVDLSSPATEEIQFLYQTVDGSAISGSDYKEAFGQITIPIGETSAKIDVEVNGDSEVEANEEFTLNLKELSSANFANNEAEYTKVAVIENDDVVQTPIIAQNEVLIEQISDTPNILNENLLDLESFIGEVTINFTVDREALYDNTVGFYKIEDAQGTITDPVTGNKFKPGDGQAYAQLAIELREPELELSVDSQSSITIQDTLSGGYLYAPFLIADGDIDSLDGDLKQVYFSFAQANSDGVEHIRSLGNNTFGFEDLPNGGDNDFDDMVIRTQVTPI
ncbi:MAG: DUF4114 domain-containing protein [Rivularia sp. (in: cyanobacteria)]|jgi:hypothetical protein